MFSRFRKLDLLSPVPIVLATFSFDFVFPWAYSIFHPDEVREKLQVQIDASNSLGAWTIAGLWLAAWLFGYWWAGRRFESKVASFHSSAVPGERLIGASLATILLVLVPCILLLLLTHPSYGTGSRTFLTAGIQGKALFAAVGLTAVTILATAASIAAYWAKHTRLTRGTIVLGLGLLLVCLAYFLVLNEMRGRARAIFPLVGLVFIFHYYMYRLPAWLVLAGGAAMGILVVGVLGRADWSNLLTSFFGLADGRNFDGYYNLPAIYAHFKDIVPLWGSGMVNAVLGDLGLTAGSSTRDVFMPIVREMWDGTWGVDPTKAGELFINFGWLGVAVGALLAGAVSAGLYQTLALRKLMGVTSVPLYLLGIWNVGMANFRGYMFENGVVNLFMVIVALGLGLAISNVLSTQPRFRLATQEGSN